MSGYLLDTDVIGDDASMQPKPLILATRHGVMLKPGKSIVVTDYIGRRGSED